MRHTDGIFLCWWKSKIALCEACGVLFVGINEVLFDFLLPSILNLKDAVDLRSWVVLYRAVECVARTRGIRC